MSWSLWRGSVPVPFAWRQNTDLPELSYPVPRVPRIAVLGMTVRQTKGILCFPEWTCAQLLQADPQALAGSFDELAEVARLEADNYLLLPSLRYPLLVFTQPGEGPLTPLQHDRLWRWFRLPIFEQIRDAQGKLLAYECDTRESFHLAEGATVSDTGAFGYNAVCGCGREGTLLSFNACQAAAGQA
jgi:hypothetical protein